MIAFFKSLAEKRSIEEVDAAAANDGAGHAGVGENSGSIAGAGVAEGSSSDAAMNTDVEKTKTDSGAADTPRAAGAAGTGCASASERATGCCASVAATATRRKAEGASNPPAAEPRAPEVPAVSSSGEGGASEGTASGGAAGGHQPGGPGGAGGAGGGGGAPPTPEDDARADEGQAHGKAHSKVDRKADRKAAGPALVSDDDPRHCVLLRGSAEAGVGFYQEVDFMILY